MTAKTIIDAKRTGRELEPAEIAAFIDGFTRGDVPDCQMSALAMAICCRGMSERETACLTDVMTRSGAVLDWDLPLPTADKHSTGGVGDKLSLVVQPLAAACSVAVPSLTGRGLGLTGGTADKLETIPGYNAALSLDKFKRTVASCGVSMTVQTEEIAPADRKLYALRDVTGTVASIPLIVSSILSKKLAEGAQTLVFDVKCGKGAFMKTREDAAALARALVGGAKSVGRKSAALVTCMDAPLGSAVGNANEVAEALSILRGEIPQSRPDVALCLELAALMVSLARSVPRDDALAECAKRLADGSALARFEAMVAAHGGSIERFEQLVRSPCSRFQIQSPASGRIASIDAEAVAKVALSLGAGRKKPGDGIDPLAGITLCAGIGDKVSLGSPLAVLSKSSGPDGLEEAASALLKAFRTAPSANAPESLVLERID